MPFFSWLLFTKAYADSTLPSNALPIASSTPSGTATTGAANTLAAMVNLIGGNALGIVALISGILAVFYIVFSGIQYIIAGGSPDKAKAARAGVINGVIGIIIIVAAYAIIRVAVDLGGQIDNAYK